jgi:hypothetical protein
MLSRPRELITLKHNQYNDILARINIHAHPGQFFRWSYILIIGVVCKNKFRYISEDTEVNLFSPLPLWNPH